jgi:lysozyme family protein
MGFDQAFSHVMLMEGGDTYTNHPADRGGPTKYGITLKTLLDWRAKPVTEDDVKKLTEMEAKLIYRHRYWDPLSLDLVQDGPVAMMLFDQAVNRGVGMVAQQVQLALRDLGAPMVLDGKIGPGTIRELNAKKPLTFGIAFFKQSQISYATIVAKNPAQAVFLRGWINRTHTLLDLILTSQNV